MNCKKMFGFCAVFSAAVLLCSACGEIQREPSFGTTTHSTTTSNLPLYVTSGDSTTTTTATTHASELNGSVTTTSSLRITGDNLKTTDPASTSQKSAPKSLKLSNPWENVGSIHIRGPLTDNGGVSARIEKDDPRLKQLKTMMSTWQGTYKQNLRGVDPSDHIYIILYYGEGVVQFDNIIVSKNFDWFASMHQQTNGKADAYTLSAAKQKEFREFFKALEKAEEGGRTTTSAPAGTY